MKISLIYPLLSKNRSKIDENKQYWPPLGLAYIASVLEKKGHIVQIIDRDYILRNNKFNFYKADAVTLDLIIGFGSQVLGFSATTPNISDVDCFSNKVKKLKPDITIVLGGPHCTGEPEETLRNCLGIDLVVRGEGEMSMLDIANEKNIMDIAGLSYRNEEREIISNADRPLIESLDDLPLPARHLLHMDYYTRPSRFISRNLSLKTTHVFTTRGCPYNCCYCAGPLMGRRKVRYHSAQRVVSEIEHLINNYFIEAVYFADDMFLSSKKRAEEIIGLFIQRGISKKIVWMAQLNPNVVDAEFLMMMKKAGCIHVEYGFESGSQRILDLMNKRTNIENNNRVARLTRKCGLRFQGNFIVGYPGETETDFNKTVTFIKQACPNNVSLNLFMALPGTEIYRKLKEEGRLIPNWDDIGNPEAPFVNYADMPKSRFEKLFFITKLKVVLPINLIHFLKDNISHPVRLIYVIFTQFRSVLFRIVKAVSELQRINKKVKKDPKILFITYHAASNPIMDSQGFSYIRGLAKKMMRFYFLTFETRDTIRESRSFLEQLGFPYEWKYLYYHKKPRFFLTGFDIFCGMLSVFYVIKKAKIDIIHARGVIPAFIAFLPAKLFKVKFFFDSRGLLADKYVGGGLIKYNSLSYKVMRLGEEIVLKNSNYFTVETYRHAEVIKNNYNGLISKMNVIPCCVDTAKFDYSLYTQEKITPESLKLVYLGKAGTWYLVEEMFDFFTVMQKRLRTAHFSFLTQEKPDYICSIVKRKQIGKQYITVYKPQRPEIPKLLAGFHAGIFFINPYKRYNSSPIKYAEYLASGLPVIINSGIGDTAEITEKERVGVVLKDPSLKEYERAVDELINLLQEGDSLRLRCRSTAQKYFSLNDGIEKYLDIYNMLLR